MSAVTEATDVFAVVRGTIAPELDRALAASRADPLPASPNTLAAEPGHSHTLFARLLGDESPPQTVVMPTRLIVRASGGAPHRPRRQPARGR